MWILVSFFLILASHMWQRAVYTVHSNNIVSWEEAFICFSMISQSQGTAVRKSEKYKQGEVLYDSIIWLFKIAVKENFAN